MMTVATRSTTNATMQPPPIAQRVTRASTRQVNTSTAPATLTSSLPTTQLSPMLRFTNTRYERPSLVRLTPTKKQRSQKQRTTIFQLNGDATSARTPDDGIVSSTATARSPRQDGLAAATRTALPHKIADHRCITRKTVVVNQSLAINCERVQVNRDGGEMTTPRTQCARPSTDQNGIREATLPEPVATQGTQASEKRHDETRGHVSSTGSSPAQQLTSESLEQLLLITKNDANETWSFPIACASPSTSKGGGAYKEATLVWHPCRVKTLRCRCCGTTTQSLRWLVQHTDPTVLLPSPVSTSDPYRYAFAIQQSGALVPLEMVLRLVRRAFMDAKHNRKYQRRRQRKAHQQEKPTVEPENVPGPTRREIELSPVQRDAIQTLRLVKFFSVQATKQDKVSRLLVPTADRVAPAFTCDVVAADERYLRPIHGTEGRLYHDLLAQVSCDVRKCGTMHVVCGKEDPKCETIQCQCCGAQFSPSTFYDHALTPLVLVHLQQVDEENALARGHVWPANIAAIRALAARRIRVVVAVRMYNGTAMKLTAFLSTLATLSSQQDINTAIRSLEY